MKRVIEVSIFDQVLMAAVSTALQVLVSPLLGTLFDSLTSLIQKEVGLVLGVNDELRKLSKTLSTILDVLEDAEDKQITDKSINNWLKDLKDAAYDAEDILDECATEALLTEPPSIMKKNKSHNIQVLFPHSISSILDFKGIKFRRKIGKRIRKLRHRFDEIANERSKFHLNLNLATRGDHVECSKRNQQRETTSFLPEPQVYGRDEEKDYLVNLLLNININPEDINLRGVGDVFVCPILGMGGLGKTTLAQMVHNDERIVKHFEIRSWVCVSEDFELKTLLKAIIESSCQTPTNLENLDSLQNRLHQILKGKRFLVVLDDVWNEDSTKWYRLKSSLTCGSSGSSIVVTTRLETVASLMSASFPLLRLRALSEKDCFTLFKHRAFDVREHELSTHPNLKEIGKEIVKKCGGVPLAAKALGSLLRFKREESEWLFVRDSKFWELPQTGEGSILPALKLSYNHLPSNLRQCFAYCSIFPKDHKLLKKELIYLWMANCFIQPKGDMHLFDIGNEIFNDLLWRSFFQDVEEDEHGNIMCKMHDLVHDLACSIVANECSIIEVHNAKTRICRNTTRHLSLDFGYSSSSRIILESIVLKFPFLLRTIYQVRLPFMRIIMVPCCLLSFSEFKCMRVLDLSQTNVTSLPEFESSNLKHLRYINFSRTDITSVPESICSLINLQTLKLNECNELQRLPKDMKKMSSLLHLEVSDCAKLTSMPTGLGELIHLQTLTFFYVSPKRSYSDDGGIEELQNLNHLRLELTIKAISYVGNSMEAKNACLTEKHNLHTLVLCWCGDTVINDYNSEEEKMMIAEVLQPHQNIRRLSIEGYEGLRLPSWMWDSSFLPNLVYLALVDCCRCQHLPPLGQLPLLKVMKIFELDSVKHIGDEFYGNHQGCTKGSLFQSLEQLHFSYMMNLEELSLPSPKGVKQVLVFPCLKNLSIVSCPELRICPPLPPTLHYLNISFCDALKSLSGGLRHLSSLRTLSIKHCEGLEFLHDDFQHLIFLRELVLGGLPKLTSLPVVGPQDPRTSGTLEHLELEICPGLTEMPKWMARANLTASLRTLRIRFCKNLKLLPTEGVEQLISSLQTVDIYKCHPDLEQQFMAMRRSS